MKIYTKVGDQGSTRMPDGHMERKDHPRVEALGGVDELNSHLGLCLCGARACSADQIVAALEPLQAELLTVGALLTGAAKLKPDGAAVARMESQIDDVWAKLPELHNFILPGGTDLAGRLHVARTVCRRAERAIVRADDPKSPIDGDILRYVNRLGDLLFALARLANFHSGQPEQTWHG